MKIPEGMLPQNSSLSSTQVTDWENKLKIVFYGERAGWELFVILVSMTWTVIALWQAFSLRQWMNSSGWFEDSAELVVDSFSQLVPMFQILIFFIIIAAAFDGKCVSTLTFKIFADSGAQTAKRQRDK